MKIGAKCGGTSPQRLGWTASSIVEIRNRDAKNGAHHAENTLRLGRFTGSNDNILFLTQPAGEKSASLYRMSINSKNLKRLIKNARFPTVSAP
jgi:hypothetical protein